MRILVVDDDAALRRLVARIIRDAGGSVIVAENGIDLWKKWRTTRCTVILSDVDMPGRMDGIAACVEVRRQSPSTQIFVMTGDPESAVRAQRAGLRVAFRKPFLERDVKDWLGALNRGKRTEVGVAENR